MRYFFFLFFIALFLGMTVCVYATKESLLSSKNDTLKDQAFVIIRTILIDGNKKTRPSVILRELLFKTQDTIPADIVDPLLERSKENLLNTSLFIFVELSKQQHEGVYIDIKISVNERWYIWPVPIFELVDRNFNQWWLTKDLSRTKYGFYVSQYNFRGRNETLEIGFKTGYLQQYSLYYKVPYLNNRQRAGLTFSIDYSKNREIAYTTDKNILQFYRSDEKYLRKLFSTAIHYTYRQKIYNTTTFELGYQSTEITDTVVKLNENYFLGGKKRQQFIKLSYYFKRDHRDNKAYPLKGYFYDFEISNKGMGLLNNDINLFEVTGSYKKYWPLNKKFYVAARLKGKLSGQSPQPYYNQRALGYGTDLVRGYEYYVVDGQYYGLLRTTFKYEVLSTRVLHIGIKPIKKFSTIPYAIYANIFTDMGYVQDKQYYKNNPLTNSWLYSAGVGLDYVTYYDLVCRVEYTINKFGEKGIFLHFTAPI